MGARRSNLVKNYTNAHFGVGILLTRFSKEKTMNALFDFRKFDPFTIGFDDVFKDLQEMSKSVAKATTYPPYNIKQVNENKYVIEMAVAGFSKTDIEVTLEGNKLVVKGKAVEDEADIKDYLFKGIANRNFNREFKINDKVEIENAELANGMLKIWLSNMVKAQDIIKKIPLVSKDA
jgi:molecular chaperone IbpA